MKTRDFDISFYGLALGAHDFEYELNDAFFTLFEYQEYRELQGTARLHLVKSETMMDCRLDFEGSIQAPCDITDEMYTQALENHFAFQVKFGEEYNDEDDEILILPHGDHQFNVAQQIYELVVLSIPAKLLGPNAGNGLEDFIEEEEDDTKNETDPRWDELKNLLNK